METGLTAELGPKYRRETEDRTVSAVGFLASLWMCRRSPLAGETDKRCFGPWLSAPASPESSPARSVCFYDGQPSAEQQYGHDGGPEPVGGERNEGEVVGPDRAGEHLTHAGDGLRRTEPEAA